MKRVTMTLLAAGLVALLAPAAGARPMGVEVWTDRGDDAVYEPGDAMTVKVRASDDAYVLVYEIDSEGSVRLLYPWRQQRGFLEGRRTYVVPPEDARVDLVVEGNVGQGYLVAIASRDPFGELPWYLRPYDAQANAVGYEGESEDEEGITREGRIVGDPYVAMERIRRRVLEHPEDGDEFSTSYTTYYVHHEVRYPRYVCYDCHRPNRWAWWDGFDPYYTNCSVFDFRVNWAWNWGPSYWYGTVPYYYYVVRTDCPPRYRRWYGDGHRWSAWDGWRRWNDMWGGHLTRYKSPAPVGYTPPPPPGARPGHENKPLPPGFIAGGQIRGQGVRENPVIGRMRRDAPQSDPGRGSGEREPRWRDDAGGERVNKPGADRTPRPRPSGDDEGSGKPQWRDSPRYDKPPGRQSPSYDPPRRDPGYSPPRRDPDYSPPRRDPDYSPPRRDPDSSPPRRERDYTPPPRRDPDYTPPPKVERRDPPPAPRERGRSEKNDEPRAEPAKKSHDSGQGRQAPQRGSEGRRNKDGN